LLSEQGMTPRTRAGRLAIVAALGVAFVSLYVRDFMELGRVWLRDDNYSHGVLVVPVIAYLVWSRRARLATLELAPSNVGLLVILASLAALLVGTAGVEFFLMRTSAVGVLAGTIVFVAGWRWLRALLFPLSLTALIIPVPPVLFYQAAFPLQLLATKFGVGALELLQIPVYREGNIITLTHTTLEVTEACSGIRSLVSLFSLAVLYGYFKDGRPAAVVTIAVSSIPIAILANGFRIAGTGIAAHAIDPVVATGFFHSFSGWAVFMTSFVMLMLVAKLVAPRPAILTTQPESLPA
jgi:exosortase